MKQTIVFIHGMFQNAKSWQNWIAFFEQRGYNCVAPSWPMHMGEPAELRHHVPAGLGDLTLDDLMAALDPIVAAQESKPIVIGHSVGGLITQLLVSRNLVSLAVPINSVAPNMMLSMDWGFFKNSANIANPFKGDEPFYMTPEGFHESFANTLSEEECKIAYEATATHDSRNVLRSCMTSSGHLDLDMPHVPMLFIAGEKDQIIPASLVQKNSEAYTDDTSITAYMEFPNRSHFICGEPGWEEVAEYVYSWLQEYQNKEPRDITANSLSI